MLALNKLSSLECFNKNHCAIFSCPCRPKQLPRASMLWFPSVLNRPNLLSIVTMPGMTAKIEVKMPACCRVNEYLKTTMPIMKNKGRTYNNTGTIMLMGNLLSYFSYLGLYCGLYHVLKEYQAKMIKMLICPVRQSLFAWRLTTTPLTSPFNALTGLCQTSSILCQLLPYQLDTVVIASLLWTGHTRYYVIENARFGKHR